MATNHQSATGTTATTGGNNGPRLSGIGSPTLGGGTPVKACKKVLPPAIPLEFLQRRNSQNLRKDDETPTNAEMILPQQQQQAQMTTAVVHQQPEGSLIESLDDSALGYYATSNGRWWLLVTCGHADERRWASIKALLPKAFLFPRQFFFIFIFWLVFVIIHSGRNLFCAPPTLPSSFNAANQSIISGIAANDSTESLGHVHQDVFRSPSKWN